MGGFSFAILYLSVAACPEPAALLRETLDAAKVDAARSVNWLAREDIRHYDLNKGRKLTGWDTYEASKVEGGNYYRLVARNGKPLKAAEVQREQLKLEREAEYRRETPVGKREARASNSRFSMSMRHLLDYHDLKCSGEDVTPEGRTYWIIDTRIANEAPPAAGRGDMALAGDVTLWIDQGTKLALRQELRVTRTGGPWSLGSQVLYDLFWNGEVMLVRRILSIVEGPARNETDQVYSGYRKFTASAGIKFEPAEIH